MARAADIPGLVADAPFGESAALVVEVRARELFDEARDVLDVSDIERVHDMRVATRRLRAVLEIFGPCFEPGLHADVLCDVKSLADALGARRDPDVQIDALRRHLAAVPAADRRGVERLVERIGERQAGGNETLAEALEEMERSDLRGRLTSLVETARS